MRHTRVGLKSAWIRLGIGLESAWSRLAVVWKKFIISNTKNSDSWSQIRAEWGDSAILVAFVLESSESRASVAGALRTHVSAALHPSCRHAVLHSQSSIPSQVNHLL